MLTQLAITFLIYLLAFVGINHASIGKLVKVVPGVAFLAKLLFRVKFAVRVNIYANSFKLIVSVVLNTLFAFKVLIKLSLKTIYIIESTNICLLAYVVRVFTFYACSSLRMKYQTIWVLT